MSSFNNAGFALHTDNLIGFAGDPWICLPIAAAVIIGGLGFPVLFELRRQYQRPIHWSMNTKLVLVGTAVLLAGGTVFLTAVEWSNPATLGRLRPGERVLAGFFQSVITRTAGFNSVDIGQMHPVSWLGMDILMFIGGGPAGTAGGLKITTFGVLFFILLTELQGGTAVNIFGKRLSRAVHRQAITVVLLAIALVVGSTMFLMIITDFGQERILFEVVSAFATVGLSTGITAAMPPAGQVVLILLMFVGRLGPVTLGAALALRERPLALRIPEGKAPHWLRTSSPAPPNRAAQADSVVVIGLGRFGGALALELEAQGTEVLGHRRQRGHRPVLQRPPHPRGPGGLHQGGGAAPALRARVRPRRGGHRQRHRGEHPDHVAPAHVQEAADLGQGHQRTACRDPGPARRGPRDPARARHGQARGPPGPRLPAGLRRVRGRLRDDPHQPARRRPSDRPLGVLGLRDKYGITIVAVKRPGGIWGHTTAQTVLYEEDQIIVQGSKTQAERFSNLP